MGIAAQGGIKSIQRGVVDAGVLNNGSTAVTITSVNTAKTTVTLLGWRSNAAASTQNALAASEANIQLENATTLRIQRGSGTAGGSSIASGNVHLSWEAVEYF